MCARAALYCTGSLRVHPVIKRSCSVEYYVFFSEFVRIRKFIAFATPPQMTLLNNLGHAATDGLKHLQSVSSQPGRPLPKA